LGIATSAELQDMALSALVKDPYLLSKAKGLITEEFFSESHYKYIYQCLNYYYNKYGNVPSQQELLAVVHELYDPSYVAVGVDDVKNAASQLYNANYYDENFVVERIEKFIMRNQIENTLKNYLPRVQNGDEGSIEEIGNRLVESMDVDLRKAVVFNLGDFEGLKNVRTKAIGDDGQYSMVIKSFLWPINNSLAFGGYKPGDCVMIVSAPGTGKTSFMLNECYNAAQQGFDALHIFIGDMSNYDGFVRYLSRLTKWNQDKIVALSYEQQVELGKKHNFTGILNRLDVLEYPPSAISVRELEQEVYRLQRVQGKHYNMIAVDYPDNLTEEDDMMYKSGGDIYNVLSRLANVNRSVVITGSQPKPAYWNFEVIPKDGAAESSRKQHIIDVMLTMGRFYVGAPIGKIHLAKVRRGEEGGVYPIKFTLERMLIEDIRWDEYNQIKSELPTEKINDGRRNR